VGRIVRRVKSNGGGTIAFSLALGAARQICRLTTTFQSEKQAFSYLHRYRTEFEHMARARLASGELENGVVVLSMLSVEVPDSRAATSHHGS
jgi:hypothetical protein